MIKLFANRSLLARIVIGMALCLLIGLGLCGLDIAGWANGIGKPQGGGENFGAGPIDALSLIVMVLSAAGLALSLALWVIVAIVKSFIRKGAATQKLFDDKDDVSR